MKQEIKERVEKIRKGEVPEGYKKTKVGIIPEEWKVIKLKEIGSFSKGKGISKSDVINCGKGCVRYGEIYTSHHVFIKNFKSFISDENASNSKLISKGDILFAGSGETAEEIGKAVCYMMDDEAYAGGDIIILSPKNKNNYFYGYVLNHNLVNKQTRIKGQGQSVVHIYSKDLGLVRIPNPHNYEENKIAEIFYTWDKAIELKEKLIKEKKEFKRGLMQKIFTGETRFLGFTDEWEVKKLGDLVDKFVNGGTPSTKVSDYWNGEIPWITGADILNQKVAFVRRHISIEAVKNSSTNIIEKNNILLVSRTGVGKLAITPFDVAISQDFTGIYTKKAELDTDYLFIYLDFAQKKLTKRNQGTSIQGITRKTLASIPIPLPPNDEQHKIVEIIRLIDNKIELLKSELLQLKEQKRGLMQLLLTGIVRVEVD